MHQGKGIEHDRGRYITCSSQGDLLEDVMIKQKWFKLNNQPCSYLDERQAIQAQMLKALSLVLFNVCEEE